MLLQFNLYINFCLCYTSSQYLKYLLFIISVCFVFSCSSGSSSDSVASSAIESENNGGSDSENSQTCFVSDCTSASGFQTNEYNNQSGLEQINAADAYSFLYNQDKTYLGDGVVVAVVDSGVLGTHEELSSNYQESLSIGDDATVNGYSNGYDLSGHGTHVSGIIGASLNGTGMQGVAPNIDLVGIAYTSISGVTNGTSNFANYVINSNATVVNMSWGSNSSQSGYSDMLQILEQSTVANDVVFVGAAGNSRVGNLLGTYWESSADNPIYPARHANGDESQFTGQTLAVVAVNTSNQRLDLDFATETSLFGNYYLESSSETSCQGDACIAYYSNFCGDTQQYCLAAPGGDGYTYQDGTVGAVYSTYINSSDSSDIDNYTNLSGTSMAAPHVSGAAAILKAAWPNLSGVEVVDILLETANYIDCSEVNLAGTSVCQELSDNVGTYNNVYGRGLLDLEAAVNNLGTSSVVTEIGAEGFDLVDTAIEIPNMFNLDHSDLLTRAVFFDKYNRDYKADLQSKISYKDTASFKIDNLINNNIKSESVSLLDGTNFSFTYFAEDNVNQEIIELRYLVEAGAEENKTEFYTGKISSAYQLNNSSFSFVSGYSEKYKSANLPTGFLELYQDNDMFYNNTHDNYFAFNFKQDLTDKFSLISRFITSSEDDPSLSGSEIITTGMSFNLFAMQSELTYSRAEYNDSLWGLTGSEALAISEHIYADIFEINLLKNLSNNLSLNLNYRHSLVDDSSADTIIQDIYDVAANSFAASLVQTRKNTKLGLGFSLPPALISARANLAVATGIQNQQIIIEEESIDITSSAREKVYEMFVKQNLTKSELSLNLFYKENFANLEGEIDQMMLFKYKKFY